MNRRYIHALALTLFLTISGTFLRAAPQTPPKAQKLKPTAAASPGPATPTVAIISVSGVNDIDSSKAYGSKSAPVVMEVFSDFQCPACKALNAGTTQKLMDEYVSTGKVYLVHRDFPLPMHAYSRVAASYARAAAHIGKGEAVEQALFQNQEVWEANGDVKATVAGVISPADMKRVQALVDAKTLDPLIDKDKQIGMTVPVNQTPTTVFHAKGQTFPYAGSITYQVLKDFLDQLIKGN